MIIARAGPKLRQPWFVPRSAFDRRHRARSGLRHAIFRAARTVRRGGARIGGPPHQAARGSICGDLGQLSTLAGRAGGAIVGGLIGAAVSHGGKAWSAKNNARNQACRYVTHSLPSALYSLSCALLPGKTYSIARYIKGLASVTLDGDKGTPVHREFPRLNPTQAQVDNQFCLQPGYGSKTAHDLRRRDSDGGVGDRRITLTPRKSKELELLQKSEQSLSVAASKTLAVHDGTIAGSEMHSEDSAARSCLPGRRIRKPDRMLVPW